MDAIGSSTKLMWFFVFIYSFSILLLIFSAVIWTYNRFKRLSFIAYIADIIFTVFILLIDIDNLMSSFLRGNPMYSLYIWNIIFLVISAGFMVISISYYRKNKKISNVFINIATLWCVIICVIMLNVRNM